MNAWDAWYSRILREFGWPQWAINIELEVRDAV